MKQIVILSGKGGTGKTTIAAAFAHLASQNPETRAVLVDADVDAANLELVLSPQRIESNEFISGQLAIIDPDICARCGRCEEVCRFDAVSSQNGDYIIDPIACEGCAACKTQCPDEAIRMELQLSGHWYTSASRYGPLFHARLRPAEENSGKLVTVLRQQANIRAEEEDFPLVIVDGPPGIGCPVIAAISGIDLVVIVTEPSSAGIHDMKRILSVALHFGIPVVLCINKADLYQEGTKIIADYCKEVDLPLIGHIPYDDTVTEAMIQGNPITAHAPNSAVSEAVRAAWQQIVAQLSTPIINTSWV
jgi:MinD superfamily P-loop ATPase